MGDTQLPRTGDPAAAFDEMRGELALLRRAIEGLTAEKEKAPDYSETLGEIAARLDRHAKAVNNLAGKPGLALTPETITSQIDTAAQTFRVKDAEMIGQARKGFELAVADIGKLLRSERAANAQRRIVWFAVGGTVAGTIFLWSFLPGMIVREMPASWLLPERIASRTLGTPTIAQAGVRLLRVGDPDGWAAIVRTDRMRRENNDAVTACEKAAAKTRESVRCTIRIGSV